MADSAPLLPASSNFIDHGSTRAPAPEPQEYQQLLPTLSNPVSLDEFMEYGLGRFGRMQFLQTILVSLSLFFDAQQTFISIFSDAEPPWHCTNSIATGISSTTCNSSSNICDLPKTAWAWDGPSYMTTISEWSLECDGSIITGLPATCFFLGCLVGGFILATLGDSTLGRKNLLFLSCSVMSIAALVTILSPNIWVYSALRFITGFFRVSIMTTALVLLMEIVGKQQRGLVVIIAFVCFSLGLLSLPAIAYANRRSSWRVLYLWTSVPAIFYCIIAYFLVSESPRWLFVQGRQAEAVAVLTRVSSVTNAGLNSSLPNMPIVRKPESNDDLNSSIKNLIKRSWAVKRLLGVVATAFGVGMVYYGILLGVDDLHFSPYLSVTFNAFLDLPAYYVTFFLLERWKRRSSILGFCILGGFCSIICVLIGDEQQVLQIGMELASLFCVCVAFNVLLVYTTELFPTIVRNSTTSMVRQAIMSGALFSPALISAGRKTKFLSYGVFGLALICSGIFVIFLPETRGETLSDSLEELEERDQALLAASIN